MLISSTEACALTTLWWIWSKMDQKVFFVGSMPTARHTAVKGDVPNTKRTSEIHVNILKILLCTHVVVRNIVCTKNGGVKLEQNIK